MALHRCTACAGVGEHPDDPSRDCEGCGGSGFIRIYDDGSGRE